MKSNGIDMDEYLPIKFLDPKGLPLNVPSCTKIEDIIRGITGKHKEDVGNELRLLWRGYLRNGYFDFHHDICSYIHTSQARRKLTEAFGKISKVVENYSVGHKTKRREFCLNDMVSVSESTAKRRHIIGELPAPSLEYSSPLSCVPGEYSSTHSCVLGESGLVLDYFGEPSGELRVKDEFLVWRTISAEWLTRRYEKWCQWCEKKDLPQNLDCDGRTDWGKATFDALEAVDIPATAVVREDDPEATKHAQKRIDRLAAGVPRMVKRVHTRKYDALTTFPKLERRRILIDGEAVAEVDMSATFTQALTSKLSPEAQGPILDEIRKGTWYTQYQPIYDAFKARKTIELRAKGWTEERIKERFEGGIKVEYQRQCIFWKDKRDRPMFDELRRKYPELARFTWNMHSKYKPSKMSAIFTKTESGIFIDDGMPQLHRQGILSVSTHDSLTVQRKHLDYVHSVLERIGEEHLGFVPVFKMSGQNVTVSLIPNEPVSDTASLLV